jgi:hypothetical protein
MAERENHQDELTEDAPLLNDDSPRALSPKRGHGQAVPKSDADCIESDLKESQPEQQTHERAVPKLAADDIQSDTKPSQMERLVAATEEIVRFLTKKQQIKDEEKDAAPLTESQLPRKMAEQNIDDMFAVAEPWDLENPSSPPEPEYDLAWLKQKVDMLNEPDGRFSEQCKSVCGPYEQKRFLPFVEKLMVLLACDELTKDSQRADKSTITKQPPQSRADMRDQLLKRVDPFTAHVRYLVYCIDNQPWGFRVKTPENVLLSCLLSWKNALARRERRKLGDVLTQCYHDQSLDGSILDLSDSDDIILDIGQICYSLITLIGMGTRIFQTGYWPLGFRLDDEPNQRVLGLTIRNVFQLIYRNADAEPILDEAQGIRFRADDMALDRLQRLGRLTIVWTPYCEEHLALDGSNLKICWFAFPFLDDSSLRLSGFGLW